MTAPAPQYRPTVEDGRAEYRRRHNRQTDADREAARAADLQAPTGSPTWGRVQYRAEHGDPDARAALAYRQAQQQQYPAPVYQAPAQPAPVVHQPAQAQAPWAQQPAPVQQPAAQQPPPVQPAPPGPPAPAYTPPQTVAEGPGWSLAEPARLADVTGLVRGGQQP